MLAENDDRAGRIGIDPALECTAPEGVEHLTIAIRDRIGRGGVGYGYRATIEEGGGDFYLSLGKDTFVPGGPSFSAAVSLKAGQTVKVPISVKRKWYGFAQFDGPIRLTAHGVPKGVTATSSGIAAGKTEGELVITASADAPREPFEIGVVGEGKRKDGTTIRRIAERRLFIAEPYFSNLPWNWRVRKLLCVLTGGKK